MENETNNNDILNDINDLVQIERKARAFDWLIERDRVTGTNCGCPDPQPLCSTRTCQECWLEYIDEQIKQEEEI